ncbi:DUF2760 domain-containing protein [Desulfonema ishimotonii]|uniref:DUF2760 domain-containing protein n=1 Tax=Desulfonema ishimotonii TaxID=45657 RepID=A0A401FW66_9BACT|nr:DUF2760 domain-containing protein [Desulfonema ishimotonii]GBC61210.1 DUF2760 domain-containing protein [Desulfonema ishimotonii]
MDVVKAYSGRSFFWILFFMALLGVMIDGLLYMGLDFIMIRLSGLPPGDAGLSEVTALLEMVRQYYMPATAGLLLIVTLLLWLCSRLSLVKLMKKYSAAQPPEKAGDTPKKTPAADRRARQQHEQRLFLHLLSSLQREGRLIDFFTEELDEYDDEDIGAAVRDIHEKCKKAMDKYLKTEAIVEKEEDEDITVEPGFDPNAIKLTGNVTGEPPFKGVVRHRGWKAGKIDMPALSGDRDPAIIAPAEVEIL